jgi:hypothetical protein
MISGTVKIQRLMEAERAIRRQRDHIALNDTAIVGHNLVWREKVAHWYYGVVDHLNESRSIVYVAMNMLDRYCAAHDGSSSMDEAMFELASMTAVFLAVRIAGSGSLGLPELIAMSRGSIRARDIISTGTDMIKTLTWNLRLITPLDFVKDFIELFSESMDAKRKQLVLDSASYLVEIAVCDASFSCKSASDLALAAVLNALATVFSVVELEEFSETVKQSTGINVDATEILSIRSRLQGVYSQSSDSRENSGPHLVCDDEDEEPIQAFSHSNIVMRTISEDQLVDTCDENNCKRKVDPPFDDCVHLKRTKYTVPTIY